jgi:hypothetical protein
LFGDVPVCVRRLLVCPCQGPAEAKSFAAVDLGAGPAPELAYVTAKFAALAPFGKVAALLSELLPISGAQNAGTVRNRTLRVGQDVVRSTKNAELPATPAAGPHQFSFWVFGMRRCGLARVGEIEALLSRAGAVEA